MSLATISVIDLHAKHLVGESIELVDVRTPAEFRELQATLAHNVPLDSLKPKEYMMQRNGSGEQPLYIICHNHSRSEIACRQFREQGFDNVIRVEGGTSEWETRGLPVYRGRQAIVVDSQVLIVAGGAAILGVVLGCFVHPYFHGVSALVGAGLLLAGISPLTPLGNVTSPKARNHSPACNASKGRRYWLTK